MSTDEKRHRETREQLRATAPLEPRVAELVNGVITRVADKWTMIILDVLAETRFVQLQRQVGGISQKMLTQTLRDMEREGLVIRTVHAEVPPRVEYRLTDLGLNLGSVPVSARAALPREMVSG